MSSVIDTINGVSFRWNKEGTRFINGLPVTQDKYEARRAACVKAEAEKRATRAQPAYRAALVDLHDAVHSSSLFGEG